MNPTAFLSFSFITQCGEILFPQIDPSVKTLSVVKKGNEFTFLPQEGGNYVFTTSGNRTVSVNADPSIAKEVVISGREISFEPAYAADISPVSKYASTAIVKLNGQYLVSLWGNSSEVDVTGLLKEKNELVLTISNEFRNRIVGDFALYGELRNLQTTADVRVFLSTASPLKLSGWAGPLFLRKYQPLIFSVPQ